jgi:hypothetical protein
MTVLTNDVWVCFNRACFLLLKVYHIFLSLQNWEPRPVEMLRLFLWFQGKLLHFSVFNRA